MLHWIIQCLYILSHVWIAFEEQVKIHGIELYCYMNVYTMFSNMSEYPPNVGYNGYHFKHGLINESVNMPLGKCIAS